MSTPPRPRSSGEEMTHLEALKAKALAVTSGPWIEEYESDGSEFGPESHVLGRVFTGKNMELDAVYIAAASPDVVLKLIERIERMTEALETIAGMSRPGSAIFNYAREAIKPWEETK